MNEIIQNMDIAQESTDKTTKDNAIIQINKERSKSQVETNKMHSQNKEQTQISQGNVYMHSNFLHYDIEIYEMEQSDEFSTGMEV